MISSFRVRKERDYKPCWMGC